MRLSLILVGTTTTWSSVSDTAGSYGQRWREPHPLLDPCHDTPRQAWMTAGSNTGAYLDVQMTHVHEMKIQVFNESTEMYRS